MLNFENKPIIGMIHLAGGESAIARALTEIELLSACGVNACLVENYHDDTTVLIKVMKELHRNKPDNMEVGVNVLPNDYIDAFEIANLYGGSFIQLDCLAGQYEHHTPVGHEFRILRDAAFKHIQVLGGVWPKYYKPIKGSILGADILEAWGKLQANDAIVVTGEGTGKTTPTDKIKQFKEIINGENPKLIIGAGCTAETIGEQLQYADGAIVGSAFKPGGRTTSKMELSLIKNFMAQVNLKK